PFEPTLLMLYKCSLRITPPSIKHRLLDQVQRLILRKKSAATVGCCVIAPASMPHGVSIMVHVLTFHPLQMTQARGLGKLCQHPLPPDQADALRMEVPPGATIQYRLTVPEYSIDATLRMVWQGTPEMTSFQVQIPPGKGE